MQNDALSLDTFARGALREMFLAEMARVTTNICDPNTSPTAKRSVTIKPTISPDDNRELGEVLIEAKSALCPANSVKTKMLFGVNSATQKGEFSEFRSGVPGQLSMDDLEITTEEKTGKVINLRNSRGGNE